MDDRHTARLSAPIVAVLCLFLLFSALWAFAVPLHTSRGALSPFQPDEPNHLAVIAFMAKNGSLPPYTIAYYESVHPPLYHLAAAGIYRFAEPLLGIDATIRVLRLAGSCLGAAILWLVWLTALPLVGRRGALLAASLAGGVPMFVSLSASVSNETLAALAGAGALAGLTAGVRVQHFDGRLIRTVALWTAIGVGTKVTCLGLLPVAFGVVWAVGRKNCLPPRKIAAQLSLILLMALTLSGWWYARNTILYGDPLRRTEAAFLWRNKIPGYTALAAQGRTTIPRYVARVTFWGWASFWGVFDAFQRPLPAGVYLCLGCFQGAAFYGLCKSPRGTKFLQKELLPLIIPAAPFAAAVAIVYYRYTWDHYTPQGRFFFPLLLPFAIFTSAGWLAVGSRNGKDKSTVPVVVVPVFLVLLNSFILGQVMLGGAGL